VSRAERLSALAALEAALADPVSLVHTLQEATDDEDAARRVAEAFGLSPEQAATVLAVQVRSLTPAHRRRVADELTVLRADWGPPLQGGLRFTNRRSAVLELDGVERRFTAGGPGAVLDLVLDHLTEEVAVPMLRPVVAAISGLPGGPVRMTVTPARDGHVEHPE